MAQRRDRVRAKSRSESASSQQRTDGGRERERHRHKQAQVATETEMEAEGSHLLVQRLRQILRQTAQHPQPFRHTRTHQPIPEAPVRRNLRRRIRAGAYPSPSSYEYTNPSFVSQSVHRVMVSDYDDDGYLAGAGAWRARRRGARSSRVAERRPPVWLSPACPPRRAAARAAAPHCHHIKTLPQRLVGVSNRRATCAVARMRRRNLPFRVLTITRL